MGSSQTSCLGQPDRNYLLFLPVFTVVLVHVFQTIGLMFDSLILVDAILLSPKQDILSHVHVQMGFDEPLGKHKMLGQGKMGGGGGGGQCYH